MKLRQIREYERESLLTRNLQVANLVSFSLGPGYISSLPRLDSSAIS